MEETIISLMIKDHAYLTTKILDFKEGQTKETFNDFKWAIQKHMFIEEKAIFLYCDCHDITEHLIKDHNKILERLSKLNNSSSDKEINDFQKFLIEHKNFEEEKFYPRLDEQLSEEQKKDMIERINAMK